MKIFVTGFHRAGTRNGARELSRKYNLTLFPEVGDMGRIYELLLTEKAFAVSCPRLAHKSLELSKHGTVFWAVRNRRDTLASMRKIGFDIDSFDLLKGFHNEFQCDPVWDKIEYDGSDDLYHGFIAHSALLFSIKNYFYEKYFKAVSSLLILEDQPYYRPREYNNLSVIEEKILLEATKKYERACMV